MALDKKSSWSEITGYEHPPLLPPLVRNNDFEDLLSFLNFNYLTPITPFLEHSQPLRWCVFGCGLTSLIATFALLDLRFSLFIHILFFMLGSIYSYVILPQRETGNNGCAVKIFITGYMVWAFLLFLPSTFLGKTYDIQADLAALLAGLLAGHSFDTPRRRDLDYSLLTSFILISYSSIISQSTTFIFALVIYLVSFLSALYFRGLSISQSCSTSANIPTLKNITNESSPQIAKLESNHWNRSLRNRFIFSSFLTVLVGFIVYISIPRFGGLILYDIQHKFRLGLHFNFAQTVDENSSSSSSDALEGNNIPRPKNSQNDINLDADVDLRQRYDVGHELVMKVKSNAASYYRGVAFRHYDGWNWKVSSVTPRRIDANNLHVPWSYNSKYVRPITQIFYVERDLPGVIFSSHLPYNISFPDQVLYTDIDGTLKSSDVINKGTIYTVKSYALFIPPFNEEFEKSDLSQIGSLPYETKVFQQAKTETKRKNYLCGDKSCYVPAKARLPRWLDRGNQLLQLPPSVTYRTKRLAHLLTHKYESDCLKTMAIAHFLLNNYTYEIKPPQYPYDIDTVDYFLFTSKKGNCEQFATAMAVLARAAGLRSRFIAGYTEGNYNPLTSMYEVYSDDAHAWTEVMIPGLGWIPVDATPHIDGPHDHPTATSKEHNTFIIKDLSRYVAKLFDFIPIGSIKESILNSHTFIFLAVIAIIAAAVSFLFIGQKAYSAYLSSLEMMQNDPYFSQLTFQEKLAKFTRNLFRGSQAQTTSTFNNDLVHKIYNKMLVQLNKKNITKDPAETPRQLLDKVTQENLQKKVAEITLAYEKSHYGQEPNNDPNLQGSLQELIRELKSINN